MDVDLLLHSYPALEAALGDGQMAQVLQASHQRAAWSCDPAHERQRLVCFDAGNCCQARSHDLLAATRPEEVLPAPELHIEHGEVADLLALLPQELCGPCLSDIRGLSDIVLDMGRRPAAFFGERRLFLVESEEVKVWPVPVEMGDRLQNRWKPTQTKEA